MTSRTKQYGYTTLTLSDGTAERFRDLRDESEREYSTDGLLTELLELYEEEVG